MKTALVIRHVPYESVAAFREPIEAAGYAIRFADAGMRGFDALDLSAPDLLVLMGGPMGVYEADRYPWIEEELRRLSARIAADRPTLGVCLGSQMVAAAMGARVYPGAVREVGFAEVSLTDEGHASPLAALAGIPVLHWHGDTFDLPVDAALLASTPDYAHQAFAKGRNVLALQFHPEMDDAADLEPWLENGVAYVEGAGTTVEAIRADMSRHGDRAGKAARTLLRGWLDNLAV